MSVKNAPVRRRTANLMGVRRQMPPHKRTEVDSASEEFNPEAIANYIARWTSPKLAGVRVRADDNHDCSVLWKSCLSQQECTHVFPERSKIPRRKWCPVEIHPFVNRSSPGYTQREVGKLLGVQADIGTFVDRIRRNLAARQGDTKSVVQRKLLSRLGS